MLINNKNFRTIWYNEDLEAVQIIDQTKLPFDLVINSLSSLDDVLEAINFMKVRGAPLIGATAAFGIFLSLQRIKR